MSNLQRRIRHLETKLAVNEGAQHIVITNVPTEDWVESPSLVKISSELWAEAIGRPFTTEQINKLRKQYADK
jgi:hypothetical protein